LEDNDGDGYSATEGDCNDSDASIGPGAEEIWYDGVDQNCDQADDFDADGDGDIGGPNNIDCDDNDPTLNRLDSDGDGYSTCDGDCDDSEPAAFPGSAEYEDIADGCYLDLDGDGYGSDQPNENIEPGTDCADDTADINPGADEEWYNEVDENCDGNDNDQDGDGDAHQDYGGGDCDDTDHNVSSTAEEIGGNAIDEDCDGRVFDNASESQTFLNMNQVSNFCSSYDRIVGNLTVQSSMINRLELDCLVAVSGAITIIYNNNLEHIDLSRLTTIESSINVYYNESLQELDLSSVVEIKSGQSYVGYSDLIESIDLSSLEVIDNALLQIGQAPLIETLDFSNLSTLDSGVFYLLELTGLNDVVLSSLSAINDADLALVSNMALESLTLSSLSELRGRIYLRNDSAVSYNFPSLETMYDGYIEFDDNPLLTSFDLSSLETMDDARLEFDKTGLTNITIPALTTLENGSYINVYQNESVQSISYPSLTDVLSGSTLSIESNDSLVSFLLNAAPNIIDSELEIASNSDLYDIYSLYNLSSANGSTLNVYYNYSLCNSVLDYIAYKAGLNWALIQNITLNDQQC